MPASYLIDREKRVVFSRGWGVVSDGDLYDHQQRLRNDPEFDPTFRQVMDFTETTTVSVSVAAIHQLASVRVFRPGTPRAIVVPATATYGLARMFQMLVEPEGETIEVFRELAPARNWLGLED